MRRSANYLPRYLCGFSALPVTALLLSLTLIATLLTTGCERSRQKPYTVTDNDSEVTVQTANYTFHVLNEGFRYSFTGKDEQEIVAAHPAAGLKIAPAGQAPEPITTSRLLSQADDHLVFEVKTATELTAEVLVWPANHSLKLQVNPAEKGRYTIIAGTSGLGPVYGMADHAAYGGHRGPWDRSLRGSTELTGFVADTLRGYRAISNLTVFPKQGLAAVNMEPGDKLVRITGEENLQGSWDVPSMPAFYYFMGSPKEIYKAYLDARNAEGYKVYQPKYEWFGVGWEAWGALAWKTNQQTVTENINAYLERGYPLEWMVVGSGFWPRGEGEMNEDGFLNNADQLSEEDKKLQATTSFGMWDERLYPDPKEMIRYFHEKGLKFTIGLRIGFIPGGPFTDQGLEKGFFLKDSSGAAQIFKVGFPVSPVHLLDTYNPAAVSWYVALCQKWLDYGIDGFKEDLYGYTQQLPDDLIDPVNERLMDQGVYVMGRNMYLGSPADLHRYNDFNYNQSQDRGPINGLAYAYSGFPYVYPDIIGGTGMATGYFGKEPESKRRMYMMRYAQYAALNPSMAFGYGPWNFDEEVEKVTLEAAQLHDRLQPYIYSNAIKTHQTGFPYTMTPLPLAWPDDPEVYGLADTSRRSYQWLIGESLMAVPLYGDDYATADSRDVYLPEGTWIDYDSGKEFQGPITLEDYQLPPGKTPLFVGGQGIVIEEEESGLVARIYPVASKTSLAFYGKDGAVLHQFSLEDPDWDNLTVTDNTSGEEVATELKRHAYQFKLVPGHDYTIN